MKKAKQLIAGVTLYENVLTVENWGLTKMLWTVTDPKRKRPEPEIMTEEERV